MNKWHYIACAGDATLLSLYIDGNEVATTTPTVAANYGTGDNFSIGSGVQNGGTDGPFDGLIDDVRVYNVALTPEEMKSLGNGADVPANNPFLLSTTPEDDATGVAVGSNLVATFSTSTIATSTGSIQIRKVNGDVLVETISVSSNQITKNGASMTINPSSDFEEGTSYYVSIPNTAFANKNGEMYAGTQASTTWNFTTFAFGNRTITIDRNSYADMYYLDDVPPILRTTVSAGTGTINFQSQTTSVCSVNETGEVVFISSGTCRISSSITNDGTYKAVQSDGISFILKTKGSGSTLGGPKIEYKDSKESVTSSSANDASNSQPVADSNPVPSVEKLVQDNHALFEAGEKAGILLPQIVLDILHGSTTPAIALRDLTLLSTGEDVRMLQQLLITVETGTSAKELGRIGATGYFGSYTKNALAEYQAKNGILPPIGYFGPVTRAQMKSAGLSPLW